MVGTRTMLGGGEKFIQILHGKPYKRSKRRCEDNITVDLTDIYCEHLG
jgi:hypothetical protein